MSSNHHKTKPNPPARMVLTTQISQRRTRRKTTIEIGGAAFLAGQPRRIISSGKELVAQQRFHLLTRFNELRAGGLSAVKAARQVGSSKTTLWRYTGWLAAGGLAALAPRTDRRGRKPSTDGAGLTPELVSLVQSLALTLGSVAKAYRTLAALPECPPKLARKIRWWKSVPHAFKTLLALKPVKLVGVQVGNQLFVRNGGKP